MSRSTPLSLAAALLLAACGPGLRAADEKMIPPQLPKAQRDNLLRFLQKHEKPDRFIPADAKLVGEPPPNLDPKAEAAPDKPIKQYTVQITSHRPVPGQEDVKQVDVYYYRPNPEKGKPGVTVKHTVDVTTGSQVGPTEVLLNHHAPISREELAEAVELARQKSPSVSELYKDREERSVQWEYLQLKINRKQEPNEPGDRVVRLVFTAAVPNGQTAPAPVPVVVNLTKGVVTPESR
jgi:hypothetical protein